MTWHRRQAAIGLAALGCDPHDYSEDEESTMIVDATRIVTTRGQYAGEEGTSYIWGQRGPMGDCSHETRGRIQGYREPCRIEVLVEGAEVRELEGYGLHLVIPEPERFQPDVVTADEAIALGYARVVE